MLQDFKELIVWQKSTQVVKQIYLITKEFPKDEMYGLTSQLRRSAVSIPSNIAEGFKRNNMNEFRNFLRIASGSAAELETQLIIAHQLGYLNTNKCDDVNVVLKEVVKMISSLIAKLK